MKKIVSLFMVLLLFVSTLPVLSFAEDDASEDFSTAKISEKEIQIIQNAGGVKLGATGGFNPTTALANWAMNKALGYSFEGLMNIIFGGEGSSVDTEILNNLEQINIKLDQVLANQQQMAAAINVMQNTVAVTDIQGYLNQYTKLITKTNMSVKNIWNSVEDIEKKSEEKPEPEREAYRQQELLSLFTNQMGASSQTPENAETIMDDMFRTVCACITTPYGITLNGKPTNTNLFGLYYEYARLAYPWENSTALEAIKNYNDAVYCQFMMITILESISLETRIKACEELEHGCTRLNQMMNNEINDAVEEITKDYQSRADYVDKAANDNYIRLWHPAYNISFSKDLYETALPKENSEQDTTVMYAVKDPYGIEYKGGGAYKIKVKSDFWRKMNRPSNRPLLLKNEYVAKSNEISAIYDVYNHIAPGKSLLQMLKESEANIPSTANSGNPKIVLNVDDPKYPLSWVYDDHRVTVYGTELSSTQPSYNVLPTYTYSPMMGFNYYIVTKKLNEADHLFLLCARTGNENVPSTASVVTQINPLIICGAGALIVVIVALVLRSRKKDSAKNKE